MFLNVLNNLYINTKGTSLPQSRQLRLLLLLRVQPLLHPVQHCRVVSPEDQDGEILNYPACLAQAPQTPQVVANVPQAYTDSQYENDCHLGNVHCGGVDLNQMHPSGGIGHLHFVPGLVLLDSWLGRERTYSEKTTTCMTKQSNYNCLSFELHFDMPSSMHCALALPACHTTPAPLAPQAQVPHSYPSAGNEHSHKSARFTINEHHKRPADILVACNPPCQIPGFIVYVLHTHTIANLKI